MTENTTQVAVVAYSNGGDRFVTSHSPLVQYYVLGNPQLIDPDASPFGWIVNYFRCDQVGVTGLQNYTAIGVLSSGNQSTTFVDNGWLTCTNSDYIVDFGPPSVNSTLSSSSGQYLSIPFQVVMPPSGKFNGTYDGVRLQAWMTRLGFNSSGGTVLASSPASCQKWVTNLSGCPSDSKGWFAVLLSADGSWLDSYPSAQNATNWSIPNVLVTSHDRIVVVLPSGWSPTGDTLIVAGTASTPIVSGSTPL
jgi:hypothetical protein